MTKKSTGPARSLSLEADGEWVAGVSQEGIQVPVPQGTKAMVVRDENEVPRAVVIPARQPVLAQQSFDEGRIWLSLNSDSEEGGWRLVLRTVTPRSGWVLTASAIAVVLVVLGWFLWNGAIQPPSYSTFRGATSVTSALPTKVLIGDPVSPRAKATAWPGAELSWSVEADGTARVSQSQGELFYRVENGGPFRVVTPAGEVNVSGTSFTVNVKATASSSQPATTLPASSGAAQVSVTVAVLEGKVSFTNVGVEVTLEAGDLAEASAGSPPKKLETPPSQPIDSTSSLPAENNQLRELLFSLDQWRERIQNGERLQKNQNGTVEDLLTNLLWISSGNKQYSTLESANRFCDDLETASHNDWRLPKSDEIEIFLQPQFLQKTYEHNLFLKTGGNFVWTSDRDGDAPYWMDDHWFLVDDGGTDSEGLAKTNDKATAYCVASGKDPSVILKEFSEARKVEQAELDSLRKRVKELEGTFSDIKNNKRFKDNKDGTVTDKLTYLTWMKESYVEDSFEEIEPAKLYCSRYHGGGRNGWRLPTYQEIQSLLKAGAINDWNEKGEANTIAVIDSYVYIWPEYKGDDTAYLGSGGGGSTAPALCVTSE